MHSRHISPGTAYSRGNSMRMGGVGRVAGASRISPEGSMRGNEVYSTEYRNYSRDGFGRGQSKHFPMRQPSPQTRDVFMEAGRMAAEYLVSKGLLPQSVLLGKMQNGNMRNQLNYNPSFRIQEGDDMQPSVGTRQSALSRLGNHATDVMPGRKRYNDEYSAIGSRSHIRGRRRNGSEWNRDLGRSGSWPKRSRPSPDMDNHHDDFSGHRDEKKNSELEIPCSTEAISETVSAGNLVRDSESALVNCNYMGDTASKENSISAEKDEMEAIQMPANMETSTIEVGEIENGNNNDDAEQTFAKEDTHVQLDAEEGTQTRKKDTDLLSLCRFAKVPKKTRTSLALRSSRVVRDAMVEEKDADKSGQPAEFEARAEDIPLNDSFHQNHETKSIDFDSNSSVPASEVGDTIAEPAEENSTKSLSFTVDTDMERQETNEELTIYGNCSTAERGEQQALEDDSGHEQNKKLRELTSSDDIKSDIFSFHPGLKETEKQQNLDEPNTPHTALSTDHKIMVDASLFSSGNVMQSAGFEEKQLFPSSFKTCDLNLMGASDVSDNHNAEPDLIFPSIVESGKQSAMIDIDLSINDSCNLTAKYSNCGFDEKDVEVIDLENDSEQENKALNNYLGSSITGFTPRDGLPNNAQGLNEIGDVQDGYGLMLSELLGSDIPNCSSIPGDMNALHNDMGLHNGEGILGDDDSIYMSLGEIPMSYLRAWEQQSQDFRKPF